MPNSTSPIVTTMGGTDLRTVEDVPACPRCGSQWTSDPLLDPDDWLGDEPPFANGLRESTSAFATCVCHACGHEFDFDRMAWARLRRDLDATRRSALKRYVAWKVDLRKALLAGRAVRTPLGLFWSQWAP